MQWMRHGLIIALAGLLASLVDGASAAEKERINPPGVYKHPNFTRVVTVKGGGKMIFVAGQTPSDIDYKCVAPGDYKGQYVQVMENLKKSLTAAGATFDDVVYRRTYVLDIDKYFAALQTSDIPRYWNRDSPPPSTLVQVGRLSDPCFLVEIDLLAVVD